MDYSSGSGAKGALSANDRAALMSNLQQQIAIANAQEMLQQLTEKCFKFCVTKPGSSLSSSEQKCLNNCMDRFFDAVNIVGKTYAQRLQKELSNGR